MEREMIIHTVPGLAARTGEIRTFGHVVKSIFPASYQGKDVVVKAAQSDEEKMEVRKNILGYERMRKMGLHSIVPDHLLFDVQGNLVLILEDCGRPFLETVKESSEPDVMYEQLLDQLRGIWRVTKEKAPSDHFLVLDRLVAILLNFGDRFLSGLVQENEYWEALRTLSFRKMYIPFVCFSDYDFTPDDTFLSCGKLKYVDPNAEVLGIPIIDLACFSGVCLVHNLPRAPEQLLQYREVAIREVSLLLEIEKEDAEKIYALGRLLQSTLSACVRAESEREKAEVLVKDVLYFAKQLYAR